MAGSVQLEGRRNEKVFNTVSLNDESYHASIWGKITKIQLERYVDEELLFVVIGQNDGFVHRVNSVKLFDYGTNKIYSEVTIQ